MVAEAAPEAGKCCDCGATDAVSESCSIRDDGTHCDHWWDGEARES